MPFWTFWKKSTKLEEPITAKAEWTEPLTPAELEKKVAEIEIVEPEIMELESLPNIPALDLMQVKFVSSPNKSTRKGEVIYIVLHHTGPGSFNGIVGWLCNKDAKASAHYVVGRAAELTQLVNTGKEAWHAGRAVHKGKRIDNHHSIGIEICNHGVLQKLDDGEYYYEQGRQLKKYTGKLTPVPASITYPSGKKLEGYALPYPDKQIRKVVALCKALVAKYPQIGPEHIITHYEIGDPEGRKNDPFGLDVDYIRKLVFYNG